MANTQKNPSDLDFQQTIRGAFNDVDFSLTTDGFLTGVVGRKITQTITTTTVSGDTSVFAFSENGIPLYTFTIIYTDASQATMLSATRTA